MGIMIFISFLLPDVSDDPSLPQYEVDLILHRMLQPLQCSVVAAQRRERAPEVEQKAWATWAAMRVPRAARAAPQEGLSRRCRQFCPAWRTML